MYWSPHWDGHTNVTGPRTWAGGASPLLRLLITGPAAASTSLRPQAANTWVPESGEKHPAGQAAGHLRLLPRHPPRDTAGSHDPAEGLAHTLWTLGATTSQWKLGLGRAGETWHAGYMATVSGFWLLWKRWATCQDRGLWSTLGALPKFLFQMCLREQGERRWGWQHQGTGQPGSLSTLIRAEPGRGLGERGHTDTS